MKQKRKIRTLNRLIQIMFYDSDFIRERTDCETISAEILETIRFLPWYIKGSCHFFLFILECFYPVYSFEPRRFSRSKNRGKQRKYIHFWCRNPIYYVGIFFKMIFSIACMTTVSQEEIVKTLGYENDTKKKLNYDQQRC